jgi:hypothetical protein
MGAHRAFGDLQLERAVGDAIVLADLALLLDAQDLVEVDAGNGREGRALTRRIDGEAGVVLRQIDVAEEGVGRLGRRDSSEPQFLRCLVPAFDGASLSSDSKDALWAKFCMGAPRRQRRSVERYSIVKRA